MSKTELVNSSDIQQGDTVVCHDGLIRTVCLNNISKDFFGTRLFGERYNKGVERVLYPKRYKGELLGYVAQP